MAGEQPEALTGRWRTIVAPAGLGGAKSAGGATTCGRAAGAVTSITLKAPLPNVTMSLAEAWASVTRAPFRTVPLEEPSSFTLTPRSRRATSARLRGLVGQ